MEINKIRYCPTVEGFQSGPTSLIIGIITKAITDYRELKKMGVIKGNLPDVKINVRGRALRDYSCNRHVVELIDYITNLMILDMNLLNISHPRLDIDNIIEELNKEDYEKDRL